MISRTTFLRYRQCKKFAWLHRHKIDKMVPPPAVDRHLQNKVLDLAKGLFKSGVKVPFLPGQYNRMAKITESMIKKGETVIYDAAFVFKDVFIMVDIFLVTKEGFEFYGVKATTKLSKRHILDLSLQHYVIKNCLNKKVTANIINIDKTYRRQGKIEFSGYFKITDVTPDLEVVNKRYLRHLERVLKSDEPKISVGIHCERGMETVECGFKPYCMGQLPDQSVFDISGLQKEIQYELFQAGIKRILDIEDTSVFSKDQRIQIECLKDKKEIIKREEIQRFIETFNEPLYFLDFEAFRHVIPPFDGMGPTTEIPFQYSLHILHGDLKHKEFLAREGQDPRRVLAERLLEDIPMDVQVLAYNMSYEKHIIKGLAAFLPDLADRLMALHDQILDLQVPFQKKWYYTNEMKGKYSIKVVLPALFPDEPDLDYSLLDIQNGMMAMDLYASLHHKNPDEIALIRQALLKYCHLDTLAMVRIYEKLKDLCKE